VQQSTVVRRVALCGTGLHSGEEVEIALRPADAGSGIVFVSLDTGGGRGDVEIPARAAALVSSARATTLAARRSRQGGGLPEGDLGGESARVSTVEHLLATLYALGIDNARVEVTGSEIPALDGSAAPLLDWVRLAGRETQSAARPAFEIAEPLEIRDGDRWIRIEPAECLRISYAIDFEHPCIGRQRLDISSVDEKTYERELAAARTFGFASEVQALRDAGLALGGSFDNTIVLDETRILNAEGLRWPDEFVRHKIVDLVGDLALLGASLHAHVQVEKGGHRLHHRLVRALLDRPEILVPVGQARVAEPESERASLQAATTRS
jgi:UDP-3-O-[3-hydroxymyristoyl] N-acetylglucosamine deacetylase